MQEGINYLLSLFIEKVEIYTRLCDQGRQCKASIAGVVVTDDSPTSIFTSPIPIVGYTHHMYSAYEV